MGEGERRWCDHTDNITQHMNLYYTRFCQSTHELVNLVYNLQETIFCFETQVFGLEEMVKALQDLNEHLQCKLDKLKHTSS